MKLFTAAAERKIGDFETSASAFYHHLIQPPIMLPKIARDRGEVFIIVGRSKHSCEAWVSQLRQRPKVQ